MADSFSIELLHPWWLGRSDKRVGRKGRSNHGRIGGGNFGFILNRFGPVDAWNSSTANTQDIVFQPLIQKLDGQMLVLADIHYCTKKNNLSSLKVRKRGV